MSVVATSPAGGAAATILSDGATPAPAPAAGAEALAWASAPQVAAGASVAFGWDVGGALTVDETKLYVFPASAVSGFETACPKVLSTAGAASDPLPTGAVTKLSSWAMADLHQP